MLPNHATQTDPYLHEIKGASTASVGQVPSANGDGTATFKDLGKGVSGFPVKSVLTIYTSSSTGTTLIPFDNTIPQNTEGTQFMSANWTPKAAGNKIRVKVVVTGSYSVAATITAALFQDLGLNAVCAVGNTTSVTNAMTQHEFVFEVIAASVTTTTFSVRVGGSTAGTYTFNGNNGTGIYGGTCISSMEITEFNP